jgi:hypothetical protein
MSIEGYLRERRDDPETGSTISIYDGTHPDNTEYTDVGDDRWVVVCEDHETYDSFEDFTKARTCFLSPSEWCEECANSVGQTAPPAIVDSDDEELDETDIDSADPCDRWNRYPTMPDRPVPPPADAIRSPDGTQWWDGTAWQGTSIQPPFTSPSIVPGGHPAVAPGNVNPGMGAVANHPLGVGTVGPNALRNHLAIDHGLSGNSEFEKHNINEFRDWTGKHKRALYAMHCAVHGAKPVRHLWQWIGFVALCIVGALIGAAFPPLILWCAIWGAAGYAVGNRKDRAREGVWLGVLLGVIGLLITVGLKPPMGSSLRALQPPVPPSLQHPSVSSLYSPDQRFWWDGDQWVPAQAGYIPVPPPPSS